MSTLGVRNHNNGGKTALGILLVLLGLITLASPFYTSLFSTYFLGWMLIVAGIAEFVYAFVSGGLAKAILIIFSSVLTVVLGAILIAYPLVSLATLTFFIGIFLLVIGGYRVLTSLIQRNDRWAWGVTSGVISFLLGILVLNHWPATALWVIGLFVGIEFITNGIVLMTTPTYELRGA